ncbi:tryptophanase-like protein [Dinothrombium tinctorium]|uniref:Tryptophanase-like protein n=1 Tax=Dinothrombium tinctorium TaxID=1965070 RepID=A0A443QD05_9ACAR|nr:tryptophanase-like protein [Dinothrombium tinctorium]RWS10175.1 tryptophanase-like protein [Dinothrombium tinctorium]
METQSKHTNYNYKRIVIPFKAKLVENIRLLPKSERYQRLKDCGFNVLKLNSSDVYIDLVTDSGSGALSSAQCGHMLMADESYVRPDSFFKLESTVKRIFGFPHMHPVHQGRGAQQLIDFLLVKPNMIIPGNSQYSTVVADINLKASKTVDCTIEFNEDPIFKGNVSLNELQKVFEMYETNSIPFVLITLTCNENGGEPVSMRNIKSVSHLTKKYGVKLFADCARFAENAYFIKNYEDGFKEKSVRNIILEMFSYFDGCIMSGRKDGIVPTGGFICVRDSILYEALKKPLYIFEGYFSNGGMSSAIMEALALGIEEVTDEIYLNHRIQQIHRFGNLMKSFGVPLIEPFGAHGLVIDVRKFFPNIGPEEYSANLLCVEVYLEGGIRLLPHEKPPVENDRFEYCHINIPRRTYSFEHLEYVADVIRTVYLNKRLTQKGLKKESSNSEPLKIDFSYNE